MAQNDIRMERHLNYALATDLENELKETFSSLTVSDLELNDMTLDQLAEQLSQKAHLSKDEVSKIVEEKLSYIYSKRI